MYTKSIPRSSIPATVDGFPVCPHTAKPFIPGDIQTERSAGVVVTWYKHLRCPSHDGDIAWHSSFVVDPEREQEQP